MGPGRGEGPAVCTEGGGRPHGLAQRPRLPPHLVRAGREHRTRRPPTPPQQLQQVLDRTRANPAHFWHSVPLPDTTASRLRSPTPPAWTPSPGDSASGPAIRASLKVPTPRLFYRIGNRLICGFCSTKADAVEAVPQRVVGERPAKIQDGPTFQRTQESQPVQSDGQLKAKGLSASTYAYFASPFLYKYMYAAKAHFLQNVSYFRFGFLNSSQFIYSLGSLL